MWEELVWSDASEHILLALKASSVLLLSCSFLCVNGFLFTHLLKQKLGQPPSVFISLTPPIQEVTQFFQFSLLNLRLLSLFLLLFYLCPPGCSSLATGLSALSCPLQYVVIFLTYSLLKSVSYIDSLYNCQLFSGIIVELLILVHKTSFWHNAHTLGVRYKCVE